MRVHGEIKILNDDGAPVFSMPWRWLLASLSGFLFLSLVIAAAGRVWAML